MSALVAGQLVAVIGVDDHHAVAVEFYAKRLSSEIDLLCAYGKSALTV